MKKRILSTMLCMVTALSILTGCGDNSTPKKSDSTEATEVKETNVSNSVTETTEEEEEVVELSYMEDIDTSNIRMMVNPSDRWENPEMTSKTADGKHIEEVFAYELPLAIERWSWYEFPPTVKYTDVDGEQWYEITYSIQGIIDAEDSENYQEDFIDVFAEHNLDAIVIKMSPNYTKFYFNDVYFEFPQSTWDFMHEGTIEDYKKMYRQAIEEGTMEPIPEEEFNLPEWDENNVEINPDFWHIWG